MYDHQHDPAAHTLVVPRHARYYYQGPPAAQLQELWLVCHGYGQLAGYFINKFAALPNAHRGVVAPEALSRFYLEGTSGRVGASWMTKAERLDEIADQHTYLSALLQAVAPAAQRPANFRLVVLGFSQGVATAWRWVDEAAAPAQRLIVWAGMLPETAQNLATMPGLRIDAVMGQADPYIGPQAQAQFRQRVANMGLRINLYTYPGAHTVEAEPLQRLIAHAEPDEVLGAPTQPLS